MELFDLDQDGNLKKDQPLTHMKAFTNYDEFTAFARELGSQVWPTGCRHIALEVPKKVFDSIEKISSEFAQASFATSTSVAFRGNFIALQISGVRFTFTHSL